MSDVTPDFSVKERSGVRLKAFVNLLPLIVFAALILSDLPLCPTKNLLGLPCPGCGLTRATTAMVSLSFEDMWHYHPLAPIIAPLVLVFFVRAGLKAIGRPPKFDPMAKMPQWMAVSILTLFVGFWVVRLLGGFGGLPDPVSFESGLFGWLFNQLS